MIHAERGYDASNLVTARVSFPHAHNMSGEQRAQVLEQIQERLAATPGIRQVAFGNGLPLVLGDYNFGRAIPSPRDPANTLHIAATLRVVSPEYLQALRLRVLQGRVLRASDTDASPGVIVVNQAFAREYLGGAALGTRLELQLANQPEWEVVGIVEDVRQGAITEPSRPEFFVSYRQQFDGVAFAPMLIVRADGDPMRHVATLRSLVREVDSSLAIDGIMTMDDRIMSSLARPRLYALVLGSLASLSLVVTGVGLFGVLSYVTARRQSEIGVRAALGATARDIVGLVLRQAFGIVGVGAVLGVATALVGTTSLSAVLYGIAPRDALSFVIGPIAIVVVALVAVIVPARRAIRVDPLQALRSR
jgi:putative ABC transport system permease protein